MKGKDGQEKKRSAASWYSEAYDLQMKQGKIEAAFEAYK